MDNQVREILQKIQAGEMSVEEGSAKLRELGYEPPKESSQEERRRDNLGGVGRAEIRQRDLLPEPLFQGCGLRMAV